MVFKRVLAYISAVVLCCGVVATPQVADSFTSMVASAEDENYQYNGSCGKNCTYFFDESTGTLTISGTGDMYYDYSPWYNYHENIKTVGIEEGITSISDGAFEMCESLTEVNIPNSVTYVGYCAFACCTSLANVTVPDSVTFIGEGAFSGTLFVENYPDDFIVLGNGILCEYNGDDTTITIPDGVISIGRTVFAYNESLKEVILPNSVTSIEYRAFCACTSLESINIPNSVTYIDEQVFGGCTSLKNVTIPSSVTYIGAETFDACKSLTSVTIPNSVTIIDEGAFADCTSLESVTISDGVTEISFGAFADCTSLKSVTIPNSVTEIGFRSFADCTSLKSVTIPSSVTEIGDEAFGYYYNEETFKNEKIDGFTIYGVEGSQAETYATENGFNFISIEEETPPTTDKPTTTDILNLKKYILGISEDVTNLDFTQDGQVNTLDLNTALNQLSK